MRPSFKVLMVSLLFLELEPWRENKLAVNWEVFLVDDNF